MERGFLSQKGSRGGRGVKKKSLNRNLMNTSSGIGVSTKSDDTMNDDTPVGVASVVKEGVTLSVVDMTVEMEKICSLEETTVLGSFPPLSTPVTTTAINAIGKSSYANVTSKSSGKKLNIRTLFTPRGNGINVVVRVESIRAISERFANTANGFSLGNGWHTLFSMEELDAMLENVWVKLHGVPDTAFSEDVLSVIATKLGALLMLESYTYDMCMQSWGRSSYDRVMIELRADVELKDNIVVAMPKIIRKGHYICNVRVEYEWKPPMCVSCKVFGHIHEKCPKNTGAGEKKTPRKPSQTSGGVPKGVELTIEVSNSNSFEVLNSVNNDVELGTNGGTTNFVNNEATSSGSSFMNVDNNSTGTTPIIHKIGKFEELITSGQAILVDKAGNLLKKVEFSGYYDSEDGVASVDNDMARSMASERVGFGTQSLLEQWRDSYSNNDYDEDPYDDMYECQDLSRELQAI
ncbi:zinc finger, CCHC-type containing protein [Tanacetum coccineum]